MKKASIIVHADYVERVVKRLHETGLLEIIEIKRENEEDVTNNEHYDDTEPVLELCLNYGNRLKRIIDILQAYSKKNKGIRSLLHPEQIKPKTITERSLDEINREIEEELKKIETEVIKNQETIEQLKEQIQTTQQDINQLRYLQGYTVDFSKLNDSRFIVYKAGITEDISSLQSALRSDDIEIYSKEITSKKKRLWVVIIIGHVTEKEIIDRVTQDKIVPFPSRILEGEPRETYRNLQRMEERLICKLKKLEEHMSKQSKRKLGDLLALYEEIMIERIRGEVKGKLPRTYYTYIINGWVLEKNQEVLQSSLEEVSDDHVACSFEEPSLNPDDPPVHLETPRWASMFAMFLRLFATPRYNELNPSIFIGVFFILFFALMLGDAGYGLVILLLSIYGYLHIGRYSPVIKDWSFLGILLGGSTVVVGLLMNSFFGDLIPRFIYNDPDRLLYQVDLMGLRLPLDALKDPVVILTIALVCGLIHLNLGLILGVIQSIRQRDYRSMLTRYISWFPLQIGGGLLIGYFILKWEYSMIILVTAGVLVVAGFILVFVNSGPTGFFNITGYVGDWLSYARLLALGLATSGMALAFNVVGEVISRMIPLIGVVLLPVILVFAHMANLVIQALGAGVHSLRLQYVEFFNRFYEGGGREFKPFHIKRRYTLVKDKYVSR
ncbi:MAG: V-type ATP synthase subunit I [Candidatus Thermoplasmatota archaeon]